MIRVTLWRDNGVKWPGFGPVDARNPGFGPPVVVKAGASGNRQPPTQRIFFLQILETMSFFRPVGQFLVILGVLGLIYLLASKIFGLGVWVGVNSCG